MKSKKKLRRELIEWGLVLGIPLILYLTGSHATVLGFIQRGILWTGIFRPSISIPAEEQLTASYDFKLTDQEGQRLDFEEFRGKTVFLNFWATWCAPCIAEMPDIQNLYDKAGDKVEFVMISVDNTADKTWKFVDKNGFDFPVYRMSSLIPKVFERQVIPTTYVISPEGKIVAERHGMAKYDTDEFREFLVGL